MYLRPLCELARARERRSLICFSTGPEPSLVYSYRIRVQTSTAAWHRTQGLRRQDASCSAAVAPSATAAREASMKWHVAAQTLSRRTSAVQCERHWKDAEKV
jgi:hypothetical protein